ncbi:hypothetical protein KDAU_41470 [Dictyobacter aurantiacus]|uniref:Uncharacterized protein n=1 Tax=Dictyobacter aurantiacus TaxID=1936993 RepID=A0A401ZJ08_9CHLR|nr:hypothetical protein KDAU_41470 [Dictyobacter aurantiacus]
MISEELPYRSTADANEQEHPISASQVIVSFVDSSMIMPYLSGPVKHFGDVFYLGSKNQI